MLWIALYLTTILGANWALETFGFVSVGFGLTAPAGVWFAGLAFACRDAVQERNGRGWVVAVIMAGAALSWFIATAFAVASGVAFLVSELADFAVYTPLRRRNVYAAVALSNTVGAVVDSALFLWLAFGSLAFIEGQIVGKAAMTAIAVGVLYVYRRSHANRRRGRIVAPSVRGTGPGHRGDSGDGVITDDRGLLA
jgi:uncharacterized PurR-regulated membrane protein YhhQ (DUF165 family)